MIKVFLVEDHHVVRNGLKTVLEQSGLYKVVGEAGSAEEALLGFAGGALPDIVLTDVNLPGMNGLELVGRIAAAHPLIKTVVLTMHDSEKYVIKAFKAGTWGYLLKSVAPEEMIFALQHVHYRSKYVAAELGYRCFDRFTHMPEIDDTEVNPDNIQFSEREYQVLELLAKGNTNQQIATMLFTSKRTVEGYRRNMLNKTGMANTAALIHYVMYDKLINQSF